MLEFALKKLTLEPEHCTFVEDDPRWDAKGLRLVGMETIIVDRSGASKGYLMRTIVTLAEIDNKLQR